MTKIGNTGAGGIRPPTTESTENVKLNIKPGEALPDKQSPIAESVPVRESVGDKFAAGDLKTTGERVKTALDSKLDAPGKKDAPTWKMAHEAKHVPNQPTPGFAPPYVPVGPVVLGDNMATPGAMGPSGETKQMNLKPDQFHINDQGNLIITNEKLIDFFKSLKENATGDINLLISNLKLPDKE
jgi:hypothetical protein